MKRACLTALVLLTMPAPAGAAGPRASHWVGAWATAPSNAGPSYAAQTVRLVVNTHRGGSRLRLRLSNRFGDAPLRIDRVSVARRAGGAAVSARSLRRVWFGGRRAVTLPRGADVVSDGVRLGVRPLADLAVSLYLRGPTTASTLHQVANEVGSYVASGDRTGAASGTGFGSPSGAWPVLTGVEVRAPRRVGTVVAFGDSITDGYQSWVARRLGRRNTRWPDFLARRLLRRDRPLSVVNAGISGNRLRLDGVPDIFGPSGLARLDGDVLAVPGVRTAIVLEGINDIGQDPAAAPRQVIASLRQMVIRLRLAGIRALIGTLTPSGGNARPTYGSAEANARRNAVNRWIRTSGFADGVIDFDRAIRDPARPSRMHPWYDSGDHLHPNARGYRRMAAAVPLSAL
ncbi:MAG: hypothetical protein JW895_07870 [Thermoleophilaceae bacterium]|nr:hypothetical protein [Thermoleophilaceae bacterium]